MQHLDEGTIHAWIDGALPADEAARVEAHAASCAKCGALVAEARGLVAASSRIVSALDVAPSGALPAFGRRAPRRWSVTTVGSAIAATLIIAAGTVMSLKSRVDAPERIAAVVDTQTATPPAIPSQANPSQANPAQMSPVQSIPAQTTPAQTTHRSGVAGGVASAPVAPTQRSAVAPTQQRVAVATPRTLPEPMIGAGIPSAPRAVAQPDSVRRVAIVPQADSLRMAPVSPMMGKMAGVASAPVNAAGGVARRSMTRSAGDRTSAVDRSAVDRTVTSERALAPMADMALASAFAGCYELNESTDVLPARFALRSEANALGGGAAREVRYVDSTGAVDGRIPDVSWTESEGRVVVRTNARGEILAIVRAGNVLAAQSGLGVRTVRVAPCR